MTQEIRELKKQLKTLNGSTSSVPTTTSVPGGGDNALIEELRQTLEKETIERLLKEDDLAKMKKEMETFKKQTEDDKSGNKEIRELTIRLRAVEDEKVYNSSFCFHFLSFNLLSFFLFHIGYAITKCR